MKLEVIVLHNRQQHVANAVNNVPKVLVFQVSVIGLFNAYLSQPNVIL